MIVGTAEFRLSLAGARSLKDKRRIISSLKDRIRNKFNVSVAEVRHQDSWQRAGLGVAAVGTDGKFVNAVLSKVVELTRSTRGAILVDYELEIF